MLRLLRAPIFSSTSSSSFSIARTIIRFPIFVSPSHTRTSLSIAAPILSAAMARARKVSADAEITPRTSSRSASRSAKAKAKADPVEVSDDDSEVVAVPAAETPNSKKKRGTKSEPAEDKAAAASPKKSPRKVKASAPDLEASTADAVNGKEASPRKTGKARASASNIEDDESSIAGTPSKAKKARKSASNGQDEADADVKAPKKAKKARKSEANGDAGEEGDAESPKRTKKSRKSAANGNEADDTPVSLSAPPSGGSKMDTLADESLPKNLTIPDPLTLSNTPKPKDVVRITSWNILSLKSSLTKGLVRYLEAEDADIVILTETKCNEVPMLLNAMYPHQTWGIGKTKGYAGTAMLCKQKPIKVTTGLPGSDADTKGRIITAEFDNYIVIGTYVVNAGENLKTLDNKKAWQATFAQHLAACNQQKPTIWGGDLNVVLDARDLSNASKKWNKSAGYTQAECDAHRATLAGTLVPGAEPCVDIWRERHPDAVGHYSYYGFRGQCRPKGIGWRLDTFIVPQRIADRVHAIEIRHEVYGASDHIPVYIDIQGPL